MSILIREIYHDYCRMRGEGHTNLLVEGIVAHIFHDPMGHRPLLIRASRQQHAEDIRRRAIDKLAVLYPIFTREHWRERIRVSGMSGRVAGFRGPIAFDNSAVMDLCTEGMRLESELAATRLNNLAACIAFAAFATSVARVSPSIEHQALRMIRRRRPLREMW